MSKSFEQQQASAPQRKNFMQTYSLCAVEPEALAPEMMHFALEKIRAGQVEEE